MHKVVINTWRIEDKKNMVLIRRFTVNTCLGLHTSVYGYQVITPVHLYYFFEVRQMHAYILRFSRIDTASQLKINIK